MSLTTTDRVGSPEIVDVIEQHVQMLRLFIGYELSQLVGKKSREWNGQLGCEAETIVHQHAVQWGLSDCQVKMCHWIAFVNVRLDKVGEKS